MQSHNTVLCVGMATDADAEGSNDDVNKVCVRWWRPLSYRNWFTVKTEAGRRCRGTSSASRIPHQWQLLGCVMCKQAVMEVLSVRPSIRPPISALSVLFSSSSILPSAGHNKELHGNDTKSGYIHLFVSQIWNI